MCVQYSRFYSDICTHMQRYVTTDLQLNKHVHEYTHRISLAPHAPNQTHTYTHVLVHIADALIHTHKHSVTEIYTYLPNHQSAYTPIPCPYFQIQKNLCRHCNRTEHKLTSILLHTCAHSHTYTHMDTHTLLHIHAYWYTPTVAHSLSHSHPHSFAPTSVYKST